MKIFCAHPSEANMTVNKLDFDVTVLGAGFVGVTTTYVLLLQGKNVCVVDRRSAAALETSFANGGQISVSHAEPWANPSAPISKCCDGCSTAYSERCSRHASP